MNIDYPKTKTEELSDGQQFVEVFKQLVNDKISRIEYNAFGPKIIYFKDGTHCGGMWLWKQTKLFK